MPSTFGGLVVFVLLLAPGLCFYLAVARTRGPGKPSLSALRELAGIGLMSVLCNGLVLMAYFLARAVIPRLPGLEPFLFGGQPVWRQRLISGTALFSILLSISCLLAYAIGAFNTLKNLQSVLTKHPKLRWMLPRDQQDYVSSWWKVLELNEPQTYRYVTCILHDSNIVAGWLQSFNNKSDESADRDVVLAAPIRICLTNLPDSRTLEMEYGSVVVSAREISVLSVEYSPEGPD